MTKNGFTVNFFDGFSTCLNKNLNKSSPLLVSATWELSSDFAISHEDEICFLQYLNSLN